MDLIKYIETPEYTQIVVLSKLRRIGGIKIEEVANELGISKSLLSLLESGKREVSQKQIKAYSDYLQHTLGMNKSNLYDVLCTLSQEHKVTDVKAKDNPIDFLFTFLKACCD